jgi:hypothetical protein
MICEPYGQSFSSRARGRGSCASRPGFVVGGRQSGGLGRYPKHSRMATGMAMGMAWVCRMPSSVVGCGENPSGNRDHVDVSIAALYIHRSPHWKRHTFILKRASSSCPFSTSSHLFRYPLTPRSRSDYTLSNTIHLAESHYGWLPGQRVTSPGPRHKTHSSNLGLGSCCCRDVPFRDSSTPRCPHSCIARQSAA